MLKGNLLREDKRPDLKQFLYGLSVIEDKIPVVAEVNSGNLSDKAWNFDLLLHGHKRRVVEMVTIAIKIFV